MHDDPCKVRKKKPSELDPYVDEIIEVLSHPGTRIKYAYWYFKASPLFNLACCSNKSALP